MPYILVHHKVKEYKKWKPIYDKNTAMRKAGGSQGARLLRSVSNPNEITLLFEWNDVEKARQFTMSEDLKKAMREAGVTSPPDISFLEEIEHTAA
jgi:heme-degrading monooxygenase HmoA